MATPPLPPNPTLRVRTFWNQGTDNQGGNRLYFTYSGSAPSSANCATIASGIASAWGTHLAGLINPDWAITEIDVEDISSHTGNFGNWTGSVDGTRTGAALSANAANNIEFEIARRYRGGKPRIYLPPGNNADLGDPTHWSSSFVTASGTAFAAFIAEVVALTAGSTDLAAHVNLSYYSGYNTTTPPWRGPGYKYPPKYRDTPLEDTVTGYAGKAMVGSQRRRRNASS